MNVLNHILKCFSLSAWTFSKWNYYSLVLHISLKAFVSEFLGSYLLSFLFDFKAELFYSYDYHRILAICPTKFSQLSSAATPAAKYYFIFSINPNNFMLHFLKTVVYFVTNGKRCVSIVCNSKYWLAEYQK